MHDPAATETRSTTPIQQADSLPGDPNRKGTIPYQLDELHKALDGAYADLALLEARLHGVTYPPDAEGPTLMQEGGGVSEVAERIIQAGQRAGGLSNRIGSLIQRLEV